MAYRFPSPCPWDRDQRKVGEVTLPSVYHGTVNLLPNVPSPLAESSAAALEWPRLREHIAGFAASPLGRAWVLALEPCSDASWIEAQQQRTAEIRDFLTGGGTFDFHGLFDPTDLLDQSRLEGAAL